MSSKTFMLSLDRRLFPVLVGSNVPIRDEIQHASDELMNQCKFTMNQRLVFFFLFCVCHFAFEIVRTNARYLFDLTLP